ncbi:MAG: hypothetical protein ACRELG_16795 [Gemmataceae bacterium]
MRIATAVRGVNAVANPKTVLLRELGRWQSSVSASRPWWRLGRLAD